MDEYYIEFSPLPKSSLAKKMSNNPGPVYFELEITARCNNNCRHCYINFPVNAKEVEDKELSFAELKRIIDEAASLGALWCLITGGEPLLREDFFDLYLYLKKKGFLVSVFTNATLIKERHIKFFKKYPPRDIEVTVYGITRDTYERVTRQAGSFAAFRQGLNLLLKNEIKVRFKAMALRSNVRELPAITQFCRERTKDFFRFDPFLHLRFDENKLRNEEIKSERLSPEEIVAIEQEDPERSQVLEKNCDELINLGPSKVNTHHIFYCGAGLNSFAIGYDGCLRLCSALINQDCVYDLKNGSLTEAYQDFVPKVREMHSKRSEFLKKCRVCPIINLCMWCPAHAYLETSKLDKPVEYFCKVAHARANALAKLKSCKKE